MLLKDEAICDTVEGFIKVFSAFTGENRRGSRLSDFRNPAQRLKLVGNPKPIHLDERTHSTLRSTVASGTTAPWVDFFAKNRRKVDAYKKIIICGVTFQTRHSAAGDSYITFESGGEIWSGSIIQILLPEGVSDIHSVLLSIEAFLPLSREDQEYDPYRLWGFSGGELFYDLSLDIPIIIAPTQILGHVAKTSIGNIVGIERPCVHTLPLEQVCVHNVPGSIRYSITISSGRTLRDVTEESSEFMILRSVSCEWVPILPAPVREHTFAYNQRHNNPFVIEQVDPGS